MIKWLRSLFKKKHVHAWRLIGIGGWLTAEGKDVLDPSVKVKPGTNLYAHNYYYCDGCDTEAKGHPTRSMWNAKTGKKIS